MEKQPQASRRSPAIILLGLLLVCGMYFSLTAGFDLVAAGEARAAEIAREMSERGNFILPSLNYQVSPETMTKPPLFHWLLIAIASAWDWSNAAMHLLPALAALGCVWLVYILASAMFDRRAGLLSSTVLASSLLFLLNASNTRIDILFSFLILAAITAFYIAQQNEGRGKTIYWFYVCAALAVIAKGPAGLFLPLVVAVLFLLFSGRMALWRALSPWQGWLLFLLIAAPWYVAVALTAPPELAENFFFGQLRHWWAGSGSAAGKAAGKAAWYYLPYLAYGMFPWSLFIPVALVYAIRDVKQQRQHPVLLLLLWFLGGLVLFSLGGKKAARYLLPMLPAGALIMGYYLQRLLDRMRPADRWITSGFAVLPVLLLIVIMGVAVWGFQHPEVALEMLVRDKNAGDTSGITQVFTFLTSKQGYVLGWLSIMLLVSIVALLAFHRREIVKGTVATAIVAWLALFSHGLWLGPLRAEHKSPRLVAEEIRSRLPANQPVYVGGNAYKHAFRWYLDRNLVLLAAPRLQSRLASNPGDWLIVMSRQPLSAEQLQRPHQQWPVDYYTITLFPGESRP